MNSPYDDIIYLPHHVSSKHAHMPAINRAAQFSPFAALSGFGAAITETARLTETRIELDEYEIAALNNQLNQIRECLDSQPTLTLTYFQPDDKKTGGAYRTMTGSVKKIDEYERLLIMKSGTKIPIEEIVEIGMEIP